MTSSRNPLQNFVLTEEQQSLLFAALNSNRSGIAPQNNGMTLSPTTMNQQSPTSKVGASDLNAFQESPYLDYDYSFDAGDTSFDSFFDKNDGAPKMIGDLPGSNDKPKSGSASSVEGNDSPEKRSHPDDDEEESGAKRRESTEKVPKKPGRKPLTSEPTSKRKAQNRAAQRAFRERKEKHVKDLELKVEELEQASRAANSENGDLRQQVERLNIELAEYKKRLALASSNNGRSQAHAGSFGGHMVNNINDVNFQFEFPTFGTLPGPPSRTSTGGGPTRSSSASKSPSFYNSPNNQTSPMDASGDKATPDSMYSTGLDAQTREDLAKFSGTFDPQLTKNNVAKASQGSIDSNMSVGAASTSSPSQSTCSNPGQSSSCGTSPEPFTQSPMGFKPVDTLATIGEENPALIGQDFNQFSAFNANEVDWLASSANNFQFDPQLFGGYRESQDSVLGGNGLGGDAFFNDAWDVDFTTPFNVAPTPALAPKKDLISQIDAAKEADDEVGKDGQLLTCNKIWERLQNCSKVQNGDFDLDGLCSELQKKAKCSGHGAVVDEQDFKHVMQKYLGKDNKDCPLTNKADK